MLERLSCQLVILLPFCAALVTEIVLMSAVKFGDQFGNLFVVFVAVTLKVFQSFYAPLCRADICLLTFRVPEGGDSATCKPALQVQVYLQSFLLSRK